MSIISGANAVTGAGAVSYQIERSLRFNSADSAYLSRTFASDGNRTTWTFSCWAKIENSDKGFAMCAGPGPGNGNPVERLYLTNSGYFYWQRAVIQTSQAYALQSNAVFRDPSGWYHVVIVWDSNNSTASDRWIVYINNQRLTFSSQTTVSSGQTSLFNSTSAWKIGRTDDSSSTYHSGYLTEVNFIDGQALDPTSFGEYNSETGVWQPIAYAGTYGTNGFYLNFSDNSDTTSTTLGKDYSGNSNNWTPNLFSVTAGAGNDSLVDTPTPYGTDTGAGGEVRGNYATLNPLDKDANITFSNGNLDAVGYNAGGAATFGLTSGKWYWEVTLVDAYNGNWGLHGLSSGKPNSYVPGYTGYPTGAGVWAETTGVGGTWAGGSKITTALAWANSDVIGLAFDADALTLDVYRNNTKIGTTLTVPSGAIYPSVYQSGTSGDTSATTYNFGQRPFAYTAPSGFKALCTQNLPEPTVVDGGDYFNAVLYTGTGSNGLAVTGTGFQPDWVWIKSRSNAVGNPVFDVLRGVGTRLETQATGADTYNADSLTSFDADGFTVNAGSSRWNASGYTYVAWNWKANGSGVSNTAGTITSTVSANTTAGFSIITYTGNGTSGATIGHGLSSAPAFFVVKGRSFASNWLAQHVSVGNGSAMTLNSTAAASASSTYWNNTSPSSTVITLGNGSETNPSGSTMVCYAFATIAGYSAFGSYTGNGSTDGPFVYTGFRPRYVMWKISSGSTGDWYIVDSVRDTYNVASKTLWPNLSNAEGSGANLIDFVSNGFKVRNAGGSNNGSGYTFIYAAFAENPFKYSLAR